MTRVTLPSIAYIATQVSCQSYAGLIFADCVTGPLRSVFVAGLLQNGHHDGLGAVLYLGD